MKTVILYASYHHGNTKKIVEAMREVADVDTIDVLKHKDIDISGYDLVGIASGIYMQKMHQEVLTLLHNHSFSDMQKVFFICTCGTRMFDYTKGAKGILKAKNVTYIEHSFMCRGYDTFGILKKIGGIAKRHPDYKDIKAAQKYIKNILNGDV